MFKRDSYTIATNASSGSTYRCLPTERIKEMTTKCPKCQGSNSHELGGNDRCFHCSECGYIQCVDATHSPGHQPAATEGTQEGQPQEYKRGEIVKVNHPRYHGTGKYQCEESAKPRMIGVILQHGEVRWYEADTVSKLVPAPVAQVDAEPAATEGTQEPQPRCGQVKESEGSTYVCVKSAGHKDYHATVDCDVTLPSNTGFFWWDVAPMATSPQPQAETEGLRFTSWGRVPPDDYNYRRGDIVGRRTLPDGRLEYLCHNEAMCEPYYLGVNRLPDGWQEKLNPKHHEPATVDRVANQYTFHVIRQIVEAAAYEGIELSPVAGSISGTISGLLRTLGWPAPRGHGKPGYKTSVEFLEVVERDWKHVHHMATPQTTELPKISRWKWMDKGDETYYMERWATGDWVTFSDYERQLSAALTQLGALRTSRDALLEAAKEIRLRDRPMKMVNSPKIAARWNALDAAIAAAQQLQEDGNV
jgi:hypothetical protein